MNKESKDVFFKLSSKIDALDHRIDDVEKQVQGLLIEINKLINMFEAFESIIHKGVKH